MKLAIVSLGCPKNQVDADVFCRSLLAEGHTTVPYTEEADIVIINTCGFIQSAKEEAIEQILEACALKEQNPDLKVVVTGCLAERYQHEIAREISEVDAVVGIGANADLPQIIESLSSAGEEAIEKYGPKAELRLGGARVIGTPGHYAWLKIAEGCSNCCSYCAIPSIRGPLRSRPLASVLQEAQWLAEQGVKELVLVAQDVTAYGDDTGENQIVMLLRELGRVPGLRWVRLLYAYPERIAPDVLTAMRDVAQVVPYLDIPIQHISDDILKSMGRKGDSQAVRQAVALARQYLPDVTLRTTVIVGYPGETEEQFEELCAFIKQAQFDRLGCFAYSPEEGTPAALLPGQVPEEERQRRVDVVMSLQSRIMAAKQAEKLGKTVEVLCDGYDETEGLWLCRSAADAPEIDANVLVKSAQPLVVGRFYKVKITDTDVYDLYADVIAVAE